MILLAIDVSMCNMGWCIAEEQPDKELYILASGTISTGITWRKGERPYGVTGTTLDIIKRSNKLQKSVQALIDKYKPDYVCAEVMTGAQSSTTAKAMGVACSTVGSTDSKLIPISPNDVKRAATGNIKASKKEMCEWALDTYPEIGEWWDLHKDGSPKHSKQEHEADSMAIATGCYGKYLTLGEDAVFNLNEEV